MSYILEALRKAEQERQIGQAPRLQAIAATERQRRRIWPTLVVIGLLVNAGVMALVFLQPWRELLPAPEVAAPMAPAPPPAPEAAVATVMPSPIAPPPALVAEPRIALAESVPLKPAAVPRKTTPKPQPVAVPAPVETPRVALADAPLTPEAPPPLQALPDEVRRALPALNLDIHVYSDEPDKRFVLINSKRYQSGDQLREGPLLEAITPDGAVLRFRDQRFVLSVQR